MPLSMKLPRQEYWSGLPFLSPGDLTDPGIKPRFPALQAVSCFAGGFFANWITNLWGQECGHKVRRCDNWVTGWMFGDHKILFELPVTWAQSLSVMNHIQAPAHILVVSGLGGLRGCGCELHPGGVGFAEFCSEGALQRRDAGDLQKPSLSG